MLRLVGGAYVLTQIGAVMAALSKLAIVAALAAVAEVAIVMAGDSGRTHTVAHATGVDAAASCGTGNPLHGRNQGVDDTIDERPGAMVC